jgi:hypothetical protein
VPSRQVILAAALRAEARGPQSVVLERLDARLARSVESMLVADVPLARSSAAASTPA